MPRVSRRKLSVYEGGRSGKKKEEGTEERREGGG